MPKVRDVERTYAATVAQASTDTAALITGVSGHNYARIQPLTKPIKWCVGGGVPVSTAGALGHLLETNASLELFDRNSIASFKMISAVAGEAAAVQITLGKS